MRIELSESFLVTLDACLNHVRNLCSPDVKISFTEHLVFQAPEFHPQDQEREITVEFSLLAVEGDMQRVLGGSAVAQLRRSTGASVFRWEVAKFEARMNPFAIRTPTS